MIPDALLLQRLHLEYLACRNRAEHISGLCKVGKWPAEDVSRMERRAGELRAATMRFADLAGLPPASLPDALRTTLGLPSIEDAA